MTGKKQKDDQVRFVITRKRGMKSVRIRAGADGVFRVSAPYGVSRAFIEDLVRKNGPALDEDRARIARAHENFENFVQERMKDVPDWTVKKYGDDYVAGKPFEKGSIYNGMPLVSTRIEFQNLFFRCYRRFVEDHRAAVTGITMRRMTSRWGSCRPKTGKLTFNLLLLYVPKECARYVIYHELCHYLEPNHSSRFWNEVAKYEPDYRELKKRLDDYGRVLIDRLLYKDPE
ncbi:MAG: M48 family metallopeptidase [Candidatus Weimeria sp.]